jgi:hypothetical protein
MSFVDARSLKLEQQSKLHKTNFNTLINYTSYINHLMAMAQPAAHALPRFLLPKLSWQASPSSTHHAARAMSIMPMGYPRHTHNRQAPQAPRDMLAATKRPMLKAQPASTIMQSRFIRRAFSATAIQSRDHHFDTLKFVRRLKEEGFTEDQAVAMMKVLSDVIEERLPPFPAITPPPRL